MTATVTLPNGWKPRFYQEPLWNYLWAGGKRAVAVHHRRAGKDDVGLNWTAVAAHQRVGNYVHMLPEAAQARKAIWQAVNPHTGTRRIDQAFPEAIRARTNEQEMFIEFANGSTWQVAGSDNYNSIVGTSFAGMVFSEYALANPAAWGYFSPILLENNGWAIFISTPRGKNHLHAMLQSAKKHSDWFGEVLTNDDTHVFTPEQMESELIRLQDQHGEDYGKALWLTEYHCSFDAAIPGSIWGDCVAKAVAEGRICEFEVLPGSVVDTGFDLGRTDDTAIWFSTMVGKQIDVFDCHASNFKDIPFYVRFLLDQLKRFPGIRYGIHWLPHDARPRTLAAGGKSILQQFEDAAKEHPELGRFMIAPRLDRQEGIQAVRASFPIMRFHAKNCEKGLEALRHYHREWDEENQKFSDSPKHDWASHYADGMRTLGTVWKFSKNSVSESPLLSRLLAGSVREHTFGRLRDLHFKRKRREREFGLQ